MVIANRLEARVTPWSPSFAEPPIELRDSPLFFTVQQYLPLFEGLCNIADSGLWAHSLRVGKLASKVGEVLGLGSDRIERLEMAGFLHDIGRIGTPRTTQAPDNHAVLGARAIAGIEALSPLVPAILFHEEHWDGTGSPSGLTGDAIPLDARIIAIVDHFDRSLSSTASAEAAGVNAALESLKAGAGKQFDRDLGAAFRQACATLSVKTLFGRPELSLKP